VGVNTSRSHNINILSLLSHILFNPELKKWSYQCNLWSIQLSFWRVMHQSTMLLAFLILHLLNKREFYSPRVLSLQFLEKVPLIGMVLCGYPMPPPMSFQVRDIIRYIMETITSSRTLSFLTWRALRFPKIMSVICRILTFHKSPAWEPWPPQ
jgi:hypothetical protein